jgi:hypothetical protein
MHAFINSFEYFRQKDDKSVRKTRFEDQDSRSIHICTRKSMYEYLPAYHASYNTYMRVIHTINNMHTYIHVYVAWQSLYVPSRPFRVNAGPVHSYCLCPVRKLTFF